MNFTVIEAEQRSAEWFAARAGKLTGSKAWLVSDFLKSGKESAARRDYRLQLVCERLTGRPQEDGDGFVNAAMMRGIELEPEARAAYEFYRDATVDGVGFIPHPSIADTGASPDGLVGEDGLVEIKCPAVATHIETLLSPSIPEKYFLQMQWQMACTGRQWCDFASYDPRLPESMRLFVDRVKRDDAAIAAIEKDVADFLSEVRMTVYRLQKKYEPNNADLPEEARLLMAGE